jgi:hypothetical protein
MLSSHRSNFLTVQKIQSQTLSGSLRKTDIEMVLEQTRTTPKFETQLPPLMH